MNTKGFKDVAKKYIIFTTLITIGVIAFLLGDDSSNKDNGSSNVSELSRCENVPIDLVKQIEKDLTIDGGGTFTNVKAVKSKDFKNVYFISGYINGPGLEENKNIAIFTSNSLELGKGMIGSVNSFAKEFSVYSDFKHVNQFDEGGQLSKDCVKN